MTFLSLTNTAPTWRREHVERRDQTFAMSQKVWSHSGLSVTQDIRSVGEDAEAWYSCSSQALFCPHSVQYQPSDRCTTAG